MAGRRDRSPEAQDAGRCAFLLLALTVAITVFIVGERTRWVSWELFCLLLATKAVFFGQPIV